MTSEFLLDAIGELDDELVLEAAPLKRYIPWKQMAGLAAAVLLCVGIAHMPGLPLNGAGAAAPENEAPQEEQSKHHLMADAADGAWEYKSSSVQESQVQEPSAAMREDAEDVGGTTQGIMEPQFFTERGVYLLVTPPLQQMPLPEGAKELGKLTAFRHDEQVYPAVRAKELVGCSVWESEDGEYLYVQQSDGWWLTAKLYQ